jgi:predicted adenylyl cyclase CyaB
MREVELKAVVDDLDLRRDALERKGGRLVLDCRLEDRRYDTIDRQLTARDEVLRTRTYRRADGSRTSVEWKGPRRIETGYRVRDEHSMETSPLETAEVILERLGYRAVKAIDRRIIQYEIAGAMVRFERYPRMDDLVEVEGDPQSIEHAVSALGLARESFTTDSLSDFVDRYEARTGLRALLCDAEGDRGDEGARP